MVSMPVSNLERGNFVRYQNRLHIVKNINKYTNYTEIVLRGIYLPYTLVNLVEGPDTNLDMVNPICHTYIINKWYKSDKFELIKKENPNEKIVMHIPTEADKLSLAVQTSSKPTYIEMCLENNMYGIYSIHN